MRRLSLLFAVVFVVPLFGYDSPIEYDGSMAEGGIEETWQEIRYEHDGLQYVAVRSGFPRGAWERGKRRLRGISVA
jgi:hypothetical protein